MCKVPLAIPIVPHPLHSRNFPPIAPALPAAAAAPTLPLTLALCSSPAHLTCHMRVALLPALRRSTINEFFVSKHRPGGYRCVLLELHAPGFVSLHAVVLCPCGLRARVLVPMPAGVGKKSTVGRGVCGSSVDLGCVLGLF